MIFEPRDLWLPGFSGLHPPKATHADGSRGHTPGRHKATIVSGTVNVFDGQDTGVLAGESHRHGRPRRRIALQIAH